MPETYPHLPLAREQPVNPRRSRPAPIRVPPPADPRGFGAGLRRSLQSARARAEQEDLGGLDDRRLIKLELATPLDPESFRAISREIEIVSQEDRTVVLAFVTAAALDAFEAILATLAEGRRPTRQELLFALKGFDRWTAADRTGWALRQEGWPAESPFTLDVELWPVSTGPERDRLWQSFETWLREQGIEKRDAVKQAGLILYRVRVNRDQAALLLRHQHVRTFDLPPRYGLEMSALLTDIQDLPPIPAPAGDAPGIVVLDSGVATGHPLLAPAVGDAQAFLAGLDAQDQHGHGTHVAGIALYGDIEAQLRTGAFAPALHLFSGRVLDEHNANDTGFIENDVESAVRYFHREYGCRMFNLSYGDPVVQQAKQTHVVRLRLLNIPREVMERQAVERGDVRFFDLAHLEAEVVPLTPGPSPGGRGERQVKLRLTDFVIPDTDLIPDEVRAKIRKWSDYIDYWAVHWDFRHDTFMNQWQAYRARKVRKLDLESAEHDYSEPGTYRVLVKVVDIFGNDTSRLLSWEAR